MPSVAENLRKNGIVIPTAPSPVANYLPYTISGNLIYVSGQISKDSNGKLLTGKVGKGGASMEHGQKAARASIINVLAQVKNALNGDLDRVTRVVKINIHVNSTNDFNSQATVGNAASDVLVQVFGDKGRHARCALGAGQLPLNVTTEIDALIEFKPAAKL